MVEITDRNELNAWLDIQPKEVSVMIASRAALRVLPLLNELPEITVYERDKIVLPVFRATTISWATMGYPVESKSITTASVASNAVRKVVKAASIYAFAVLAVNGTANATAFASFANAEASASDATAAAASSASSASDATAAAASSVTYFYKFLNYDATKGATQIEVENADFYKSVKHDATQIEAGRSVKEMMLAPLWSDDCSKELLENWQQLKSKLLTADENWQVWTDWYDARLLGTPKPIEKLEIDRANIDDELWRQGAKVVNAHIKELIKKYEPKLDIPDQSENTVLQTVWEDNHYVAVSHTPDALEQAKIDGRETAYDIVKDFAEELAQSLQGSNAAQASGITDIIAKYNEELRAGFEQVDLVRLGMYGLMLQSMVASAFDFLGEFEQGKLNGLLTAHTMLVRQDERWRSLEENAQHAVQPSKEEEILIVSMAEVVIEAFENHENIVDPLIPKTLKELGNFLERDIRLHHAYDSSFENVLIGLAQGYMRPFAKALSKEVKSFIIEVYQGLKKVLVKATIGGVLLVGGGLVTKVTVGFAWLPAFIKFLFG